MKVAKFVTQKSWKKCFLDEFRTQVYEVLRYDRPPYRMLHERTFQNEGLEEGRSLIALFLILAEFRADLHVFD